MSGKHESNDTAAAETEADRLKREAEATHERLVREGRVTGDLPPESKR